jgi:nucleoside-diphosphate-sugar epimerase
MNICISGASGYIGSKLMKELIDSSYNIIELSRKKHKFQNKNCLPFDFFNNFYTILPSEIDCIVHLATLSDDDQGDSELIGTAKLLKESLRVSARFIYLSSQTALNSLHSQYSINKKNIEELVLNSGGIVLRVGMVYGGEESGMYGRLMSFIKKLKIFPTFTSSPIVQPVHIDTVIESIIGSICLKDAPGEIINIGMQNEVLFEDFINILSIQNNMKVFFVYFPSIIVMSISKFFPKNTIILKLRSLIQLRLMDTSLSIELLKLTYNKENSDFSKRNVYLIKEAIVIFSYILGERPTYKTLQKYLDAVTNTSGNDVITFGCLLRYFPILLCMINFLSDDDSKFKFIKNRINIATVVAESMGEWSEKFSLQDQVSISLILKDIIYTIIIFIIYIIFPFKSKFLKDNIIIE